LALALVAHPAIEVDQRLHLVVADGGHGDDVAAVGVADEHDRTGHTLEELGQVGGVAGEIAERVGEADGAEASALEGAEFGVVAGGVGQAPWTNTIVGVAAAILATLLCGRFARCRDCTPAAVPSQGKRTSVAVGCYRLRFAAEVSLGHVGPGSDADAVPRAR
jgi:hypothetical protein